MKSTIFNILLLLVLACKGGTDGVPSNVVWYPGPCCLSWDLSPAPGVTYYRISGHEGYYTLTTNQVGTNVVTVWPTLQLPVRLTVSSSGQQMFCVTNPAGGLNFKLTNCGYASWRMLVSTNLLNWYQPPNYAVIYLLTNSPLLVMERSEVKSP